MTSWGGPERPKGGGIDWPSVIAFLLIALGFLLVTTIMKGSWG